MMISDGRADGDDVFLEYNPTPYSGGYDQALAYGEPVSPCHETCYPPESMLVPSLNRENFTYGRGSHEDSPYQVERGMDFKANSAGDVDHARYPLDGEPWKDDRSHPYGYGCGYGYGNGYDYGDNWSCGWDSPKRPEEEEYSSGHPVSYADSLADWLHLHQEDSSYQSHLGEDNPGRQDTRNGCTSEWKSAVEYIFGPHESLEHSHADGSMPDYRFCDYQSYDRVPTANTYRLQERSFSRGHITTFKFVDP